MYTYIQTDINIYTHKNVDKDVVIYKYSSVL